MTIGIRNLILILFACFGWTTLSAQAPSEVLGIPSQRANWKEAPSNPSRSFTKDTLFISAGNPFFDDFSSGRIPDSTLWDLEATIDPRYPIITRRSAVRPPSLGCLTFDGASPSNNPYDESLFRGNADRLESHFIDLSGFDAVDEIAFSFYLQPQGVGHSPSSSDFFKVYFNALKGIGSDTTILLEVFGQTGGGLTGFKQVVLPITSPLFLHDQFYFVFESEGYINGLLNMWHLDYVVLGTGRNLGDTLYQDWSPLYASAPPMDPFTAVPFQQYKEGTLMKPFDLLVSKLDQGSITAQIQTQITDPVGGQVFTPAYKQQLSQALNGVGKTTASFSPYNDNQPLNNPYSASFKHEVKITSPSDDHPENDAFVDNYRIDTLFAYDDGEADSGYGLNRPRGFGQQFEILSEDSMMAVWISFAPQIDYLGGGTLSGTLFSATIWHDAHPDSILWKQSNGMEVRYGDTTNHFERYSLGKAISMKPGIYWVGITQFTDVSIGVGFDRTYQNDHLISWDSAGNWVPSRLRGTLMIRPEMRNIEYNSGPFTSSELALKKEISLRFFPNPITGDMLQISSSNEGEIKELEIKIMDLQGRVLDHRKGDSISEIKLPDHLTSGLYLVQYQFVTYGGKRISGTEKVIKINP